MDDPDTFMPEVSEEAVKIAVRVRPFNQRELKMRSPGCITMKNNSTTITHPEKGEKTFTYDFSYWSCDEQISDPDCKFSRQEDVYHDLGAIVVRNAVKGFNCCLMAYGQTGTGKSYSMLGGSDPESFGLIPRICQALFQHSDQNQDASLSIKMEVSYLEIYAENIRDLLVPHSKAKHALRVREHPETGPYVEDLTKEAVSNYGELEMLMQLGNKERTVAATAMNEQSSRSHAVFTVILTQTTRDGDRSSDKVSKLQLVDLAGSERASTAATSGVRLKEAANINLSLTMLGKVIHVLAKNSKSKREVSGPSNAGKRHTLLKGEFVPYRDSTLTWLLKDSLGGNSKAVMLCAISPAMVNYDETLTTLRFADRVKDIVTKAVVNEDTNARVIRALRQEVDDLRAQLSATDPTEVRILHEKLAQSQKLIEELNKTWESKLVQAKLLNQMRIDALRKQGLMVQQPQVDSSGMPFLVNLNEDPSLNESLIYSIPITRRATIVCRSAPEDAAAPGSVDEDKEEEKENEKKDHYLVLDADDVAERHCVFEVQTEQGEGAQGANGEGEQTPEIVVYLQPSRGTQDTDGEVPKVYVNGEILTGRVPLYHGDHIIIGEHHVFRFSHRSGRRRPGRKPAEESKGGDAAEWNAAVEEKLDLEGKLQEMQEQREQDLARQKNLEVKMAQVERENMEYQMLLQELRRQPPDKSPPPAGESSQPVASEGSSANLTSPEDSDSSDEPTVHAGVPPPAAKPSARPSENVSQASASRQARAQETSTSFRRVKGVAVTDHPLSASHHADGAYWRGSQSAASSAAAAPGQRKTKSGYMQKRGGWRKNWKHRFFTIKGDDLLYFETREQADFGKPKGAIRLPGAVLQSIDDEAFNKRFCFGVKPSNTTRTYILVAPTAEEMIDWINTLRANGVYDPVNEFPDQPAQTGTQWKMIDNSLKEGYLMKRGEIRKNWHVRFFVLLPDRLLYFEKKEKPRGRDGPEPVSRGTILLEGATLRSEPRSAYDKDNCFTITPRQKDRTYIIVAADEESLRSWTEAIRALIEKKSFFRKPAKQ